MKTGDIITASELAGIINEHGCGTIMINGSIPEPYQDVADLELDDEDMRLGWLGRIEGADVILQLTKYSE